MGIDWMLDKVLDLSLLFFKKWRKDFRWEPSPAMRRTTAVKNISTYPKTHALIDGDIDVNQLIEGAEAFTQALRFYVLTERGKYPIYSSTYGIEESTSIFVVRDVIEFQRQCQNIAQEIMAYFDEWIVEIYSIHRKRDTLSIEIKVSGKPDTLICKIIRPKAKTQ